jgi:hypothetical protein
MDGTAACGRGACVMAGGKTVGRRGFAAVCGGSGGQRQDGGKRPAGGDAPRAVRAPRI